MDDFVVNVRQIGNYPAASSTGPNDLLLLQQNGLGGAYASITPADLVSTALLTENPLKLAPTATIQWNGGQLAYDGAGFSFNGPLKVPSLNAETIAATTTLSAGGQPVATVPFVNDLVDGLVFVSSFNFRSGDIQLTTDDVLRAGGAPIWDAHFGGHITVPTAWNALANDDTAASTAFVQAAICSQLMSGHVVLSYNGRGGDVIPIADDITTALTVPGVYGLANTAPIGDTSKRIANTAFVDGSLAVLEGELQDYLANIAAELDKAYAPLDSPQFVGIPTAPTAAQTVNSGQLATTAFVHAAVTASTTGVSSFNTRTGAVVLTTADVTAVGAALLASPAFTGTPTSTTAAPGDNTTKIATTAYVQQAVASFNAGVVSFNTRTGAVVLTTADLTAVGGALLASPTFSGTPAAPTAAANTNTTQLATTAFVTQAIAALPAPVTSFNGRTGAISFQGSDISAVNGALLASPAFTGTPTAPTPTPGNSSTQLATCAFVAAAISGVAAGVTSYNGRTGAVTSVAADITSAGGALLASPSFTGTPAAPTPAPGTNTTQLATTAFVQTAMAAVSTGVTSFNGRTGAVTFQASDVSAVGGALLASPAFTGNPTAPTPSPGDSDTSIATTAFVMGALAGAGGVSSFNARAGAVTLTAADVNATNTAVRYDAAQGLTAPQQAQARSNIGSGLGLMNCGQLSFVSATQLAFKPYNGDQIRINGVLYPIPAAGIAGLGNPTSVFVGNVAGQTLLANTTYMIFAFNNAGVVTANFASGAPHSPSSTPGNIGTETVTGSDVNTLIGMVRTGATVVYGGDILTLSWFNRRNKGNIVVGASGTTLAAQAFLTWADEAALMSFHGYSSCAAVSNSSCAQYVDGVATGAQLSWTTAGANYTIPVAGSLSYNLTEGLHSYDVRFTFGAANTVQCSSSVVIRG
jgi:hypothetical protein